MQLPSDTMALTTNHLPCHLYRHAVPFSRVSHPQSLCSEAPSSSISAKDRDDCFDDLFGSNSDPASAQVRRRCFAGVERVAEPRYTERAVEACGIQPR